MKRWDFIIIAVIAVIALAALLFLQGSEGDTLIVSYQGEQLAALPLHTDMTRTFTLAQGVNTIEIRAGRARVSGADCPDEVCVNTGWIDKPGQTAVCLPHKFLIRVSGKADYDAVSW